MKGPSNEHRFARLMRCAETVNRVCAMLEDVETLGEADNVVYAHCAMSLVVHQLVEVCRASNVDVAEIVRRLDGEKLRDWAHERPSPETVHKIVQAHIR